MQKLFVLFLVVLLPCFTACQSKPSKSQTTDTNFTEGVITGYALEYMTQAEHSVFIPGWIKIFKNETTEAINSIENVKQFEPEIKNSDAGRIRIYFDKSVNEDNKRITKIVFSNQTGVKK